MIKWWLFKRKLMKNPWSLDPYRKISEREAARLIRVRGGYPSATHIMELARMKSGKTPDEWFSITGFRAKPNVRERKMRLLIPYRKIAVAAICVVFLTAYLGFTPSGRALAETIYTTITEFFDGMLYMHPVGTNSDDIVEPAVEDASMIPEKEIDFSSINEIRTNFGKGFFYLSNEKYEIKQICMIEYSWKDASVILRYVYGLADIALVAEYPAEQDIKLSTSGKYCSFLLSTGSILEGSFYDADHSFAGATVYNDLVFSVYINNVTSVSEIKNIASDLIWLE